MKAKKTVKKMQEGGGKQATDSTGNPIFRKPEGGKPGMMKKGGIVKKKK